MKVGFLHPGEMGSALGHGVRLERSPDLLGVARAQRGHAETHDPGWVDLGTVEALAAQCEVLVAICPSQAASVMAQSVARAGFSGLYIDANPLAPAQPARTAGHAGARRRTSRGRGPRRRAAGARCRPAHRAAGVQAPTATRRLPACVAPRWCRWTWATPSGGPRPSSCVTRRCTRACWPAGVDLGPGLAAGPPAGAGLAAAGTGGHGSPRARTARGLAPGAAQGRAVCRGDGRVGAGLRRAGARRRFRRGRGRRLPPPGRAAARPGGPLPADGDQAFWASMASVAGPQPAPRA